LRKHLPALFATLLLSGQAHAKTWGLVFAGSMTAATGTALLIGGLSGNSWNRCDGDKSQYQSEEECNDAMESNARMARNLGLILIGASIPLLYFGLESDQEVVVSTNHKSTLLNYSMNL
jgi:hypothetical protein